MPSKSLLIEGWRSSSHSYALVDQHQSLCLSRDPRFALYHTDVPFLKPEWAQIDAGFDSRAQATLTGLRAPLRLPVDCIYRISWPLRVHAGSAHRIFLFCTCEFGQFGPTAICGPGGDARGIDFGAVELITTSRWSRDGLLAVGFKEPQIHTVPLGVDPSLYETPVEGVREKVRADLQLPEDSFIYLNVSNMMWNKGIGPLIAAFARHRMKNENAVLVLKGGDTLYGSDIQAGIAEAQRLNAEVLDPRVAQSIRYVSQNLTQAALATLFLASDVYVSPYRAEGFNLPVLEALAAGLPVIATDGGATDDFCPERYCRKIESVRASGPHGYHLEPSLDSLVEHMQSMTDSAVAFRTAALAGCCEIRDRYSWQSVTRQLGDLFDA